MAAQRDPIGRNAFIQERNFDNALQKLENSTVLIIMGPSGCGKSELALQLQKEYRNKDRVNFFGDLLLCESKETLLKELRDFIARANLKVRSEALTQGKLDDVFDDVFAEMNICFGNKMKFLIFDDAERESDVHYHIDQAMLSILLKKRGNPMREKWKIVMTTQDKSRHKWLDRCDFLPDDSFLEVNGLYDEEIHPLLKQSKRGEQFTDEDVTLMKETFGTRPLMLNVVKSLADQEVSITPSEALRNFVAEIKRLDGKDPGVSGLFLSIKRVIDGSEHANDYGQFIMMLTMFHETNIPKELLISCAEVIVSSSGVIGIEDIGKKAKVLHRDFIHDMTNRSLFDEPKLLGDTTFLSFHKLFKQSMKQFSAEGQSNERDLKTAQKALLALTRVMPRDGRGHKSHIYSFMYRHAETLLTEVKKLEYRGFVDRTRTPLILLLMCILRLSMGYCRYSMKLTTSDALKHVEEALTIYSMLFMNCDYNQIEAGDPARSHHLQRAVALFDGCFEKDLSPEIADWVKNLPFYLPLTKRDKKILLPETEEADFLNGHLDEEQMQDLRFHKKALQPNQLVRFYSIELLAEIYAMAAKICGNSSEHPDRDGFNKAANFLYQKIGERCEVTLLGKIILEREMLNVKLKSDELTAVELDQMIKQWKTLQDTNKRAFECGLMRADLTDDPYNAFLCNEGLVRCKGRKCALGYDEATFNEVSKLFKEQLKEAEQQAKSTKLQMNKQTISKAYWYYGEFLLLCSHARDAVRAVIDSLYHLSGFFDDKAKEKPCRELEKNCGKARPLWDILQKAYDQYNTDHASDGNLLEEKGTDDDARRIQYIKQAVKSWRLSCGPEDETFLVLERILESSGIVDQKMKLRKRLAPSIPEESAVEESRPSTSASDPPPPKKVAGDR